MTSWRAIYPLFRADFLDRVRSYAFLLTTLASILAAILYVPPSGALYAVVTLSGYRGVYTPAWIGATVSMSLLSCLLLLGFFLVKNGVERDFRTGVGQILESSSTGRLIYMSGKFLSNFAVLFTVVILTGVGSGVMVFIRGESTAWDWGGLVLPYLLLVLPVMAAVAGVALVFEAVPLLRRGFGNVLYFFVWSRLLDYSSSFYLEWGDYRVRISSLFGFELLSESFAAALSRQQPGLEVIQEDGFIGLEEPLQTFLWTGMDWTYEVVLGRMFWILAAILLVIAAAILFRGFDPEGERIKRKLSFRIRDNQSKKTTIAPVDKKAEEEWRLPSLDPVRVRPKLNRLVQFELKLIWRSTPYWWKIVAGAGIGACFLLPFDVVRGLIGPLCWVWPILQWSSAAVRERHHQTEALLYSSPSPAIRQPAALWLSGWILALVCGSGFGLRMVYYGGLESGLAWLIGSMFIPALALAAGIWSSSSKLFEVTYLILVFVGLLNGLEAFDFMGTYPDAVERRQYIAYLLLTLLLVLLAYRGRKHQLEV